VQMDIERGQRENDGDLMDSAMASFHNFLAAVVVSIPRAWVVNDAPASLDWRDPDSFDWLRGNRFTDLSNALGASRIAAEKN